VAGEKSGSSVTLSMTHKFIAIGNDTVLRSNDEFASYCLRKIHLSTEICPVHILSQIGGRVQTSLFLMALA
jgi:hypothetical protein